VRGFLGALSRAAEFSLAGGGEDQTVLLTVAAYEEQPCKQERSP